MPHHLLRNTALALLLAGLTAGPAMAQRNGNTWGGFHHQPTRGGVRAKERAAGVALPSPQRRAKTQKVDTIYDQLMSKEQPGGNGPMRSAVRPLQPGAASVD